MLFADGTADDNPVKRVKLFKENNSRRMPLWSAPTTMGPRVADYVERALRLGAARAARAPPLGAHQRRPRRRSTEQSAAVAQHKDFLASSHGDRPLHTR